MVARRPLSQASRVVKPLRIWASLGPLMTLSSREANHWAAKAAMPPRVRAIASIPRPRARNWSEAPLAEQATAQPQQPACESGHLPGARQPRQRQTTTRAAVLVPARSPSAAG